MDDRTLLLTLAAVRVDGRSIDWSLLAREAAARGGLSHVLQGQFVEQSKESARSYPVVAHIDANIDEARRRVDLELTAAAEAGARLVTVFDDDYPLNLIGLRDRPPFFWVRGSLQESDARSVAVVGTRACSELGLRRAKRVSHLLTEHDVTVVSGLARGIDTAAHTTALESGGRTIAVLGTGITKCYPRENAQLADRIVSSGQGALVSQFWPTSSPARWTFPRRNHVTSGLALGTVVIEASSTSGAKMQARVALQQGKEVWLLDSLVDSQDWAAKYVESRGAKRTTDVAQILDGLDAGEATAQQIGLDLLP